MWLAGVLNCVRINCELMDLAEQYGVAVFSSEHFGI
jgi:hypothetical protein